MNDIPIPRQLPCPDDSPFILRRLGPSDLETLVAYRSHPDIARYQSWDVDWSLEDARAMLKADRQVTDPKQGQWIQLMIETRATNAVLGDVAVNFGTGQPDTVEIGVTLAPSSQGKGIATTAVSMLLSWLFDDLGCHRVYAQADERNVAVHSLFTRLGFRHEATHVDADWFKGAWSTLCVYAMLRE